MCKMNADGVRDQLYADIIEDNPGQRPGLGGRLASWPFSV
jgi:hypothetical protein